MLYFAYGGLFESRKANWKLFSNHADPTKDFGLNTKQKNVHWLIQDNIGYEMILCINTLFISGMFLVTRLVR